MLKLHDAMKADDSYQASVGQEAGAVPSRHHLDLLCRLGFATPLFPAAAPTFEQTRSKDLRWGAMKDVNKSPLRILERLRNRALA